MENGDPEQDQLMEDQTKGSDRWDQYPYFEGVDREQFTDKKRGQYYHLDNGYEESEARDENFFYSICLCICPTIKWYNFITIISLFEIVVFAIECSLHGVNNSEFLAPDAHSMEVMGWQDSKKIKN